MGGRTDIPEAEARRILAALPQRSLLERLAWEPKQNHEAFAIAIGIVVDQSGATVPGQTVEMRAKRGVVVDRCKYQFILFQMMQGHRRRVYELEVSPPDKRTHNSKDGTIYGSHEHFGGGAYDVDDNLIGCDDWATALDRFKRVCSFDHIDLNAPC